MQGALEEQQAAVAAAGATSVNQGLTRDAKEEKIEAMITRREGKTKRSGFSGWKDVVVMKKLDKYAAANAHAQPRRASQPASQRSCSRSTIEGSEREREG